MTLTANHDIDLIKCFKKSVLNKSRQATVLVATTMIGQFAQADVYNSQLMNQTVQNPSPRVYHTYPARNQSNTNGYTSRYNNANNRYNSANPMNGGYQNTTYNSYNPNPYTNRRVQSQNVQQSLNQGMSNLPSQNVNNTLNANTTGSQTAKQIKKSTTNQSYQLNIIKPNEERAYYKPAQHINIQSQVSPKLTGGDAIIIMIDGKEMAMGENVHITTDILALGEHELTVQVINKYGRELASRQQTFHLLQRNIPVKKKREKKAKIAKYNALPWYKKVLTKSPDK